MKEAAIRTLIPKSLPSRAGAMIAAAALAGMMGFFEYATGYDFHLTALFLVPICAAEWVAGRRAGLLLGLLSTVICLVTDLKTSHSYRHPFIPYWNAIMLLAFFWV